MHIACRSAAARQARLTRAAEAAAKCTSGVRLTHILLCTQRDKSRWVRGVCPYTNNLPKCAAARIQSKLWPLSFVYTTTPSGERILDKRSRRLVKAAALRALPR